MSSDNMDETERGGGYPESGACPPCPETIRFAEGSSAIPAETKRRAPGSQMCPETEPSGDDGSFLANEDTRLDHDITQRAELIEEIYVACGQAGLAALREIGAFVRERLKQDRPDVPESSIEPDLSDLMAPTSPQGPAALRWRSQR